MEIKIPEVGESVFEALVAKWLKQDGEQVSRDEPLCEMETDKITMEINADASGVLRIRVPEGTTVKIGSVIGDIEESGPAPADPADAAEAALAESAGLRPAGGTGEPGTGNRGLGTGTIAGKEDAEKEAPPVVSTSGQARHVSPSERKSAREKAAEPGLGPSPADPADAAEAALAESAGLRPAGGTRTQTTGLKDSGLRFSPQAGLGKQEKRINEAPLIPPVVRSEEPAPYSAAKPSDARTTRKPMTPIRKRIAERLLAARQQTAMLTTFNEADMGRMLELRRKFGEEFRNKHGVKLGFMSFFIKACCEALREFPQVNASIDGDDIVYHDFYDIGIAVSGEKGLVVPVLRDADRLRFAEIEQAIVGFTEKIRTNRLTIADLEGGTFTITNGGIFGSLMSTPILNPPQSGVLGMHAIQDRPEARNGTVVVRPMMYLALSYDHRIIDGREAVLFLKKVKEYIEDPEEMLLEG